MGRVFGRTIIQAVVWSTAIVMALLVLTLGTILILTTAIVAATTNPSTTDASADYKFVYGQKDSKNKLLAIPIDGVIYGDPGTDGGGGLFGGANATYGYEVKQQLIDAIDDDQFDGVVLVMNTPGGTIYGSDAIRDGVRAYKERSGKPITAFVASMSASGGMLGMAPADRIFADHGTLIGSIGVRIGPFEYYDKVTSVDGPFFSGGVTTQNGISYTEITAGRGKDEGSPYRPLTDEEKANFQRGVDNSYAEFVQSVSLGRKIPEATIRDQIGALIYDEVTAKKLNLIDDIATREEAFTQTAELAKLRGSDWQVVRKKQASGGLLGLLGLGSKQAPTAGSAATGQPFTNCISQRMPVAYYGNLAALCGR
jgi:protease-4